MPAPTIDAVSTATSGVTGTLSWSHVLGSGSNRKVQVLTSLETNPGLTMTASGVTFNGTAMTQVSGANVTVNEDPGSFMRCQTWYIDEADLPAAGTYTITVSYTGEGSVMAKMATAISLIDAAQGAPEASATGSATVDGTNITVSITTVTDNALIITNVACNIQTTFTHDASQTERSDQQAGGSGATQATTTEVKVTAGADTQSCTAAATWGRAIISSISVAPVAASPSGPPAGSMLLLGVGI